MQDRYYARLEAIKDAMLASLGAQYKRDRGADNRWFSDLAGRTLWVSDIPTNPDAEQERSDRYAVAWTRKFADVSDHLSDLMREADAWNREPDEQQSLLRAISRSLQDAWLREQEARCCQACKTHLFDESRVLCHDCGQAFNERAFEFESEGFDSPNQLYAESDGFAWDYRFSKTDEDGATLIDEFGKPEVIDEGSYIERLRQIEELKERLALLEKKYLIGEISFDVYELEQNELLAEFRD